METDLETVEPKTAAVDPRIALLEQDREAPFTAAQRAKLPEKLRDLDESIAALRAFRVADGGSEPAIIFRAARPEGVASIDHPVLPAPAKRQEEVAAHD